MKKYNLTFFGACLCFFTQALIINIFPFFYSTYNKLYAFSVPQLTILTIIIFAVQLVIDAFGYHLSDKIGYKKCIFLSCILVFLGLISTTILPKIISPFVAIIIAISLTSVGSGFIEIITSPMVEALPFETKSSKMSLLHSFYCWGHLIVILCSTLLIRIIPIEKWYLVFVIWSLIPLLVIIIFLKAPVIELKAKKELTSTKNLFFNKIFIFLLISLLCAGAIEQGLAQWISYFFEKVLGLNKTQGDLIGVCGFAFTMALSRLIFGLIGKKLRLKNSLIICGIISFVGIGVSLFGNNILSLIGIILAGLSIGIMWPGVISVPNELGFFGGTKMFSYLALAGDLGCLLGPTITGTTANISFNLGISLGGLFGIILSIMIFTVYKLNKK